VNKLVFIAQLSLDFVFSHLKELPKEGEEVLSKGFNMSLGGGTLTYPIILHRLGIDTKVIVKKSKSIHGDLAYKLLLTEGIKDIITVEPNDFDPVMTTAVLSFEKDRSFVSNNSSKAFQFADHFLFENLKDSKVVFATEHNLSILPKLKNAGCLIVFDIGWSESITLKKYSNILPYVDYFTPNEKEAIKLTGTSDIKKSLSILKEIVPYPIISCGKDGCKTILEDGKILHVSIPEDITSVDSTGAGDNFMAGLIYGINKNWNITECLKFANCSGALSTTGYGCYGAGYTLENIMERLSEIKVKII